MNRMHLIMIWLYVTIGISSAIADQPNIVLVMADDQGWGDMAYNGHSDVKTPNFDNAAKTGICFNRFYAAAPVCSPTRASVLTGRHPNRMGVFKWGYPMRPQEITIAEVLRKNGYATAHFGKWHLGSVRHNSLATPGRNGFEHWISAPNFYDNNPTLCDNGKATRYSGESSMVTADLALDWMKKQVDANRPFFAVVWLGSPHAPHQASAEERKPYESLFQDEANQKVRRRKIDFLGEVTGMDRAYGKIRNRLRDWAVEDNTVLWYTSDNGALPQVGSAGPFRGHKGQVYEGGLLVPSILHWPARIKSPAETDARCSTCDIFPTLLEVAGIKYNPNRPIDGTSLLPFVLAPKSKRNQSIGFWDYTTKGLSVPSEKLMRELLQSQQKGEQLSAADHDIHADRLPQARMEKGKFLGHSAWIQDHWKLHRIESKNEVRYELYFLRDDPYEQEDRYTDQSDRADEMKANLEEWLQSVVNSYHGEDY